MPLVYTLASWMIVQSLGSSSFSWKERYPLLRACAFYTASGRLNQNSPWKSLRSAEKAHNKLLTVYLTQPVARNLFVAPPSCWSNFPLGFVSLAPVGFETKSWFDAVVSLSCAPDRWLVIQRDSDFLYISALRSSAVKWRMAPVDNHLNDVCCC